MSEQDSQAGGGELPPRPAEVEIATQQSDRDVEALQAELEEPDRLEIDPVEGEQLAWRRPDRSLIKDPTVIRALIGIVAAMAIMIWPDRTDRILTRVVGLALIAFSVTGIRAGWRMLRSSTPGEARRFATLLSFATSVAGLAIGVYLVASRGGSQDALARLIGLLIVGLAIRELAGAILRPESERSWLLIKAVATGVVGGLILLYPTETFAAVTVLFAIGWLALGSVAIAASLDPKRDRAASYRDATELIGQWLLSRPKDADDRRALYDKILYEGPLLRRRVIRFATLMSFAAIIASMGVITDSTAVVIGAMLIAPLMTPLMGMAISLVMGWPVRLTRSAGIAAGGILLAISIGVFLGLVAPTVIDTASNGQILARSSPTVLDLIVALAAGAAGAYGLSRPDVSDSLPGVAIAISLVPPLTVVGIAYSQRDWIAGHGALLLFATNMLAILIMGGLTFIVTGVTPLSRVAENQHRVKTWVAAVAAMTGLVFGALLLNGSEIADNAFETGTVEEVVADWLEPYQDHESVRTGIAGDVVTVVIIGPAADPPRASELADLLGESLERPITAEVRLLVEERDTATSD